LFGDGILVCEDYFFACGKSEGGVGGDGVDGGNDGEEVLEFLEVGGGGGDGLVEGVD